MSGLAIISVGPIWIYVVFATDFFLRFLLQGFTGFYILHGPGQKQGMAWAVLGIHSPKTNGNLLPFCNRGMNRPLCHACSVQCRMRAPKPHGKIYPRLNRLCNSLFRDMVLGLLTISVCSFLCRGTSNQPLFRTHGKQHSRMLICNCYKKEAYQEYKGLKARWRTKASQPEIVGKNAPIP